MLLPPFLIFSHFCFVSGLTWPPSPCSSFVLINYPALETPCLTYPPIMLKALFNNFPVVFIASLMLSGLYAGYLAIFLQWVSILFRMLGSFMAVL